MENSSRNGFPNRILLTGGAGFIGSHVAEALLARGVELSIVDNLDASYSQESKRANLEEIRRAGNFTFHETDVCDFPRLREAFSAAKPRAVIHFAEKCGVTSSFTDPLAFGYVNVTGTFHVLELCRDFGVERFILGSSSSVYGANSPAPFQEDFADMQPISPYAVTKLEAENMARDYARVHGFAVACLRFFSVYGPRMRPDSALFAFADALASDNPLRIFGDGSSARDFTWIGDAVPAVSAALDYSFPSARASSNGNGNGGADGAQLTVPFEIFNLGASSPVSLNRLVTSLEKTAGRPANRHHLSIPPGDVPLTFADNSKARRLLGFCPATPLEDGLEQFVAWHRYSAIHPQRILAKASAD
ncbi:MAG TPA: NAD-dependent epimerase/dehydratase family protein [Candidatus Acidoferrales bacterium]|jgi:UDP-glucuronate 4-epimerase|nr:NAD-dependent epimerase/dehydratase family protein [Candidatus Acidoferrales bacterium]